MRHPHVFLAGFVGGIILDKQALVLLFMGVVIGAAGTFLLREARAVWAWVQRHLDAGKPYDHGGRPW